MADDVSTVSRPNGRGDDPILPASAASESPEKALSALPLKGKRVAVVVYSHYEVDSRVQRYCESLRGWGAEVDVFALRREGQPQVEDNGGVQVHHLQYRRKDEKGPLSYLKRIVGFLLRSAWNVSKRHVKKRYDLVHVHSVPDFLVFAALVPKLSGTPAILDIHDILPELYASKFHKSNSSGLFRAMAVVERISGAFADHVIVANDVWRNRLLSRGLKPEKCTSITNYADERYFVPRPRRAETRNFRLLYPGTLSAHQGIDLAIAAFARVAKEMPGSEFHIYGEGPAKSDLTKVVAERGLTDRVQFFAPVPVHRLADIMREADLAVEPKRSDPQFADEAASTKIREFMAVGVPVIASRTTIHNHYYSDSTVLFFPPGDEAKLAEAILKMYREPETRRQYREAGLQYTAQHNWRTKQLDYLGVIQRVVRA